MKKSINNTIDAINNIITSHTNSQKSFINDIFLDYEFNEKFIDTIIKSNSHITTHSSTTKSSTHQQSQQSPTGAAVITVTLSHI